MIIEDIKVELLGCHEKCVEFIGGNHAPEVNPVGYTDPVKWRLECPNCYTVLKIFPTYDEAVEAGKQHAVDPTMYNPRGE
jgi:hypothetical protein